MLKDIGFNVFWHLQIYFEDPQGLLLPCVCVSLQCSKFTVYRQNHTNAPQPLTENWNEGLRKKKKTPTCDLSPMQQLNKKWHCTQPVQSSPPVELKPLQRSKFRQISILTWCLSTCCTWLSVGKTLNGLLAKSSKTIWPWSAVVCLGPLFPSASHCLVSKEPRGGGKGGLYVQQNTFALTKHTPTDSPEHNSTSPVSLQFHHQDVFNPLYVGARSHIQMRQVPKWDVKRCWQWWSCQPWF